MKTTKVYLLRIEAADNVQPSLRELTEAVSALVNVKRATAPKHQTRQSSFRVDVGVRLESPASSG